MKVTITTTKQAGLFFGQVNGKTVCGPYMNKGMAARQAKRISETAAPTAHELAIEAAKAEGRKMGLTEDQITRFIARQA